MRSLYSQNIQRGPSLGECQEVLWRFVFFVISQSKYTNEVLKHANEVFKMCIYNNRAHGKIFCTWITLWVHCYPPTTFCNCSRFNPLDICPFFVISQSEQICKWDIYHAHSVTTDRVVITCAHHYPHTKFRHCSLYKTLDICLFLLASQNRYANEILNTHICWWQTTG